MSNTAKIHEQVQTAGGIVKIDLGTLRDELGHSRIGKKVLESMAEHLTESGLGFFPGWMMDPESNPEPRQWQELWVYERDGSARSAVCDAFSDPETHDLVSALNLFTDAAPNFAAMSSDERLSFVKAAVCDFTAPKAVRAKKAS